MAEGAREDGPDFGDGIELSTLAEGRMLPGHVAGDPVLLVRRGAEVFAIGGPARTMAHRCR